MERFAGELISACSSFSAPHRDKYGRSLVMLASKRGFTDILKILIELSRFPE